MANLKLFVIALVFGVWVSGCIGETTEIQQQSQTTENMELAETASESTSAWTKYINENYNLSIELPSKWKTNEDAVSTRIVRFDIPVKSGIAYVEIWDDKSTDLGLVLTNEFYRQATINTLSESNLTVVSHKPLTVNGKDAYLFHLENTKGKVEMVMIKRRDGGVFLMVYGTDTANFDKFYDDFEKALNSFEAKDNILDCSDPNNYNTEKILITDLDVRYDWYPSLNEIIFKDGQYKVTNAGCTRLLNAAFYFNIMKDNQVVAWNTDEFNSGGHSLMPGESDTYYGGLVTGWSMWQPIEGKAEYGPESTNDIVLKERGEYTLVFQVREFRGTKVFASSEKPLKLT